MGFHALGLIFSHYWDGDFARSLTLTLYFGLKFCITGTGILHGFGLKNEIRTPPTSFRTLTVQCSFLRSIHDDILLNRSQEQSISLFFNKPLIFSCLFIIVLLGIYPLAYSDIYSCVLWLTGSMGWDSPFIT